MGDFSDFNKDSELNSYEKAMRELGKTDPTKDPDRTELVEDPDRSGASKGPDRTELAEDLGKTGSAENSDKQNGESGYPPLPPHSRGIFHPYSVGEHFLAALVTAIIATGLAILGVLLIERVPFFGGVCFMGTCCFGISSITFVIQGIALATRKNRKKTDGNGTLGFIIGVTIFVVFLVGVVHVGKNIKGRPSGYDPKKKETSTAISNKYIEERAQKELERDLSRIEEDVMAKKDKWDDYPAKYREIFRAAESGNFKPTFLGDKPEMSCLEWINELNVPGNAFAEFIAEKRDALKLKDLNARDRAIVYLLLYAVADGNYDPMNHKAIVATGYSEDGTSDRENKLTYGKDNYWYARAVIMNDDRNIYVYEGQGLVKGHGASRDDDLEMAFRLDVNDDRIKNYVDPTDFRKCGRVTPDNVKESFGLSEIPKYSEVNFEISEDLKELLYVFGVYVNEIAKSR